MTTNSCFRVEFAGGEDTAPSSNTHESRTQIVHELQQGDQETRGNRLQHEKYIAGDCHDSSHDHTHCRILSGWVGAGPNQKRIYIMKQAS